jgi:hypothetical protein
VYGSNAVPKDIKGWTKVSPDVRVGESQTIRFDHPASYRRYLLWVTKLPEENKAAVQELSLFR